MTEDNIELAKEKVISLKVPITKELRLRLKCKKEYS